MSRTISESCRLNSGLQPSVIVKQRYLFFDFICLADPRGSSIAHGTSFYDAVSIILELIFSLLSAGSTTVIVGGAGRHDKFLCTHSLKDD